MKRAFQNYLIDTFALPPKADIWSCANDVCFGPSGDIRAKRKTASRRSLRNPIWSLIRPQASVFFCCASRAGLARRDQWRRWEVQPGVVSSS
jgi:hypothetical protein